MRPSIKTKLWATRRMVFFFFVVNELVCFVFLGFVVNDDEADGAYIEEEP
jgi:hypothetical protein